MQARSTNKFWWNSFDLSVELRLRKLWRKEDRKMKTVKVTVSSMKKNFFLEGFGS